MTGTGTPSSPRVAEAPSYGQALAAARSLLFVPGHRSDRFAKAAAAGADGVIVDLEDAVAPDGKDAARDDVALWLAGGARAVVRINAHGTEWFEADLAMAAAHGAPVMLPKAEDPAVLESIACRTGGRSPVLALIETAAGVENAAALCRAPNLVRTAFGNIDLAAQLGVDPDDHQALAYARSRVVCASAAAGLAPPLDGVTADLAADGHLPMDIAHARRLGFAGKLCIHPRQLGAVHEGFTPSAAEKDWARRVLAAGEAVTVVDGQMVDRPVLERARRILRAAGG
ncbi:HpcH/HpaI aldolase/citrate lyase family protein [Streptomyces purpurogeneiscleroticus]|uniref:HpcH/HpaI aldolase/citrate lyase family protein n=1 Tax=Streptomyces purpurogeneiscleroticus TaxID=68259 RepID=UPI001CBB0619|nr:CoA ester lyase [Streptomyces purpurogeneiscleroticus]MBZ4016761.1 CoA ester lyase [Streptomyces purpurogeneiscleroticus]